MYKLYGINLQRGSLLWHRVCASITRHGSVSNIVNYAFIVENWSNMHLLKTLEKLRYHIDSNISFPNISTLSMSAHQREKNHTSDSTNAQLICEDRRGFGIFHVCKGKDYSEN